jgi:hypothetical protein
MYSLHLSLFKYNKDTEDKSELTSSSLMSRFFELTSSSLMSIIEVKDVKTLAKKTIQANGEVHPYRDKKVITIGVVSELTGLSERQIRYYEECKLIFPERTSGGTRKYSFHDVDRLVDIANKMEDGLHTSEIRTMEKKQTRDKIHKHMFQGQLKSTFY